MCTMGTAVFQKLSTGRLEWRKLNLGATAATKGTAAQLLAARERPCGRALGRRVSRPCGCWSPGEPLGRAVPPWPPLCAIMQARRHGGKHNAGSGHAIYQQPGLSSEHCCQRCGVMCSLDWH